VLALAAAAESGSEHPLASALLDHAAAVFGLSDLSLSRPSASLAADRFNQGACAETCQPSSTPPRVPAMAGIVQGGFKSTKDPAAH